MNKSKLSMSKLAAESKQKPARSKPGEQKGDADQLFFNRLEAIISGSESTPEEIDKNEDPLYREALDYYMQAYNAVRDKGPFSVEPAIELIKKIIGSLEVSDTLFIYALHRNYRDNLFAHHSINVAVLSILIGGRMGIDESGLLRLGVAALLHDIGTARVSDDLLYKSSALTDGELKEVRQRTLLSHQILEQMGERYDYLSNTAVQVYERFDGSGYPRGLKGVDINKYARIIGLADCYEALIHSRPHRDRFLHFSAIKQILRSEKHSFDRRYLKALVDVVSLFPVFSCVKLNSGAVGRVLKTNPGAPLRPRLKILFDAQKKSVLSERIVDLRDNPLLYITDAVAEEDLNVASA